MTTRASAAAATGLPSDRRSLLSGAALASLVAATASVPAIAEPAHPDRDLLDLLPTLRRAASERSRHAEACDVAWDRIEYPAYPEAVFWQKRDFPGIWIDKTRLDSIGPEDSQRYLYVTDGVPEQLRATLSRWNATALIDRNVGESTITRVEEILAGAEVFAGRLKSAQDACGYTAADEAFNESDRVARGLLQRIAESPARTAEGVVVKVFAALVASYRSADPIERDDLPRLLAELQRKPLDTVEMLLLSAQVAAAKMVAGGAHA